MTVKVMEMTMMRSLLRNQPMTMTHKIQMTMTVSQRRSQRTKRSWTIAMKVGPKLCISIMILFVFHSNV